MKNLSLIINLILAVAIAALFVVVLSDNKSSDHQVKEGGRVVSSDLNIVYINTDSLLMKYEYARVLSDILIKKEESSRTDLNERVRVFQQDMNEFQRKLQNNGFLSLERAQNEERRLINKEQELQELNEKFMNELMREQDKMNRELRDTLTMFLSSYCAKHSYELVLSNTLGDNVLYAEKDLDITDDVVEILNERYKTSKK